jgi:DNA-binding transcriptional MerR regulator
MSLGVTYSRSGKIYKGIVKQILVERDKPMNDQIKIGDLARRAGVNAKTIRYYEEIGVLPAPVRTESGYRLYAADDAAQLEFIRHARSLGFSLGEIKEILSCRARGKAPCAYVSRLISHKIEEVERRIEELRQLRQELAKLQQIARRQPLHVEAERSNVCHILESRT